VRSEDSNGILLSGAADGADTIFGEHALSANHEVVHFMGPRNEPSVEARLAQGFSFYYLDDTVLEGPQCNEIFRRVNQERSLGKWLATAEEEWRDSRRNVFQVLRADRVYAVGYRQAPSAETPALDVGGGTGWACQCYADRFYGENAEPADKCQLYFFDDGDPDWGGCLKDPATHRRWSKWDALRKVWQPLDGSPPPPRGLYAGIGTTVLDPEWGERAIRELMALAIAKAQARAIQALMAPAAEKTVAEEENKPFVHRLLRGFNWKMLILAFTEELDDGTEGGKTRKLRGGCGLECLAGKK